MYGPYRSIGGPSDAPVRLHIPASAVSCEPNPGVSARGPLCPMLQVDSITSPGRTAASAS